MPIKEGSDAPDFTLPDENGDMLSLSTYKGKYNIILYFYPADFTPGCTSEACGFRDSMEQLEAADTIILGISTDSTASHSKFKEKYKLPFHLLCDADRKVHNLYEAHKTLFILPPRKTYVIGKDGKIKKILSGMLNINHHINGSIETVKQLEKEGGEKDQEPQQQKQEQE